METYLVCFAVLTAFGLGAISGALGMLWWMNRDYEEGWELTWQRKEPEIKMPPYITPEQQEWMRQEIQRQKGQ